MPGLDDILGNQTLRTIFVWQVAAQVLGALLDPFWTQLKQTTNAAHPERVIDPADLADMVVRNRLEQPAAAAEAAGSGINSDRFDLLVRNTGEPIGLMQALEAFRRGIIPAEAAPGHPSLAEAVHTARYMDEWLPVITALRFSVPGAADVVDGFVKGHIDEATARQKFSEAGLDPDVDWSWMASARGNPPGLADVARLVHRGIIPKDGVGPDVVSFEMAVRESAYMDKWSDALFEGATYVPPVRTIVALLRAGAVSESQAGTLLAENGVRPADAAAYIHEATVAKVQADKDLAKGDIETLYYDRAIDAATASEMLQALGYHNGLDQYLLTLVDLRREMAELNAATNRIGTYYVARKLNKAEAEAALDALSVPADQRDRLLHLWDIERTSNVKLLTAAEIADAFKYGIIDQPTAISELGALGYTPYDAWVRLSVTMHGPLPSPPPATALIPQ